MIKHKALNQLLCAAVVNRRFRETLLRDPAGAIASGYEGCTFSLSPEERDLVVAIRAQQFEDFAAQVHDWILGNGCARLQSAGSLNPYKKNERNGSGASYRSAGAKQPFVELYRAPVAVPA